MRQTEQTEPVHVPPDLELAGACIGCGGDLAVRVRSGSVRSVCRSCGWMSSPLVTPHDGGIHVTHPAVGLA